MDAVEDYAIVAVHGMKELRLMQLEGLQVDKETQQAIEDWRYWVDRGYEL